jgi:hypothetical protein
VVEFENEVGPVNPVAFVDADKVIHEPAQIDAAVPASTDGIAATSTGRVTEF